MKPVTVLKKAVCEQLRLAHLPEMMELLRLVNQSLLLDDVEWDEVVSTALLEITDKKLEVRL